ncbi:MAG: PKD domain-containing protein [Bacteroidales bacterium]
MKKNKVKFFNLFLMLFGLIPVFLFSACGEDEDPIEDPIASFQYEIGEDNFLEVTFMNFSQNAETYSWDFDDGNSSAEENPVHVYDEFGNYDVTLTATNSAGTSASFTETIEIKDPDEALALLAGQTSKTWKLQRFESSMGVGPNIDAAFDWWFLENDGSRPCVYYHEFTFNRDGEYIFDDKGSFWGEGGLFHPSVEGTCFEAIPENMIGPNDEDLSAWLGNTHQFEYDPSTNTVTITGEGAWIGIPKVATDGEVTTPQNSISFEIEITENEDYDHMFVKFIYADFVWVFNYASYSDPNMEPDVVEEQEPFGEDLPDITPDDIFVTFAARDAENLATIDTVTSGSSVIFGVDDPADAEAEKVGQFIRTGGVQYQELQFRTTPDLFDIQFDNFTTAKIDIYVPDDTEFAEGGLQRMFVFGFADMSQTQEWWTSPTQFFTENDDFVVGEWTTYTFDLTEVKERADLDMIFLGMGGGGHEEEGIFYVRNLIFE